MFVLYVSCCATPQAYAFPYTTLFRSGVDLVGDAGPGGVDQVDHGYARVVGALDDPDDLLNRARTPGARLDGRVVGHQADRPAVDRRRSGDHSVSRQPVGEGVGVQAILHKGSFIDEPGDALAGEELPLGCVRLVVALSAARHDAFAHLRQVVVHSALLATPQRGSRAASLNDR